MAVSKKYNDNLVVGGAVRDGNGNRINTTYANVDLSNLSTTGNDKIKDVFIAEYGVTTYQEVLNAYNTKKQIFCKRFVNDYNIYIAPLTYYSPRLGEFIFSAIEWTYFSLHCYTINSSSEWNNTSETIGSSTTPVFVNSGRIMSTGLSIENSRFDGQWVQSFVTIMESNGTKNGVQIDLSSYLPDDGYNYNVKFNLKGYDDDSSYYYRIETDIFDDGLTTTGSSIGVQLHGGTHSRQNVNIFDLPVGTGRYIKVYGSGADTINIYALGYRRLGTNS